MALPLWIDYGFKILERQSMVDGFFTFGKHRYMPISEKEVNRHYLAYCYVRLQNQPAGCPEGILEVIWFWGDRKARIGAELASEAGQGDYYPDFDELLEEQEGYYRQEKMEQEQYVLPGVKRRGFRDGELEDALERLKDDPFIQNVIDMRRKHGGI